MPLLLEIVSLSGRPSRFILPCTMERDGVKKVPYGVSKNIVSLYLLVVVELRHNRRVGQSATFYQSYYILTIDPRAYVGRSPISWLSLG